MAGTATPIFPQSLKTSTVRIANADTTTIKTLVTPPTNGSKVVAVLLTSDDTSSKDVQLVVTKGGVDYPIGTINMPITAGTIAATSAVNGLDVSKIAGLPLDRDGQRYLLLESGAVLGIKALTTLTSGKFINAVAIHSDF